jgi:hypothetical protein
MAGDLVMKMVVGVAVGCALLLGGISSLGALRESVEAPAPPAEPFTEANAKHWVSTYRHHRQAERIPEVIALFRANGVLAKGAGSYGVRGFLAGVFEQEPTRVDDWLSEIENMKPAEQETLLSAAWFAGGGAARRGLRQVSDERVEQLFGSDLSDFKAIPISEIVVRSPQDLDLHWGHYFATGAEADLRAIVSAVDHPNPTIAAPARWSLRSNAEQHPDVMAFLEKESSTQAAGSTIVSVLQDAKRSPARDGPAGKALPA